MLGGWSAPCVPKGSGDRIGSGADLSGASAHHARLPAVSADQAQAAASGSQRLKRCFIGIAEAARTAFQESAQACGSRNSAPGSAALRATKPGNASRPDGCPIGW